MGRYEALNKGTPGFPTESNQLGYWIILMQYFQVN